MSESAVGRSESVLFKKGDRVLVSATVFTKHQLRYGKLVVLRSVSRNKNGHGSPRPFMKAICDPFEAIVVGRSVLISGLYYRGRGDSLGDYDPGDLVDRVYHKVFLVEPLWTQSWEHPLPCLMEDMQLISPTGEGDSV